MFLVAVALLLLLVYTIGFCVTLMAVEYFKKGNW